MRYAHFAPDHLEDAVRLNPITAPKMATKWRPGPFTSPAIFSHIAFFSPFLKSVTY